MAGIATAVVVEEYLDRFRGPASDVEHDAAGRLLHVVWALPAEERSPAAW